MKSKSVTMKNKYGRYEGDDIYFHYQISDDDKKQFYITNPNNAYGILLEPQDLLNAIETVTENKSKIPKELLDEHAISLWKDVFFNCQGMKVNQKTEMANAAVDEFYKKFK